MSLRRLRSLLLLVVLLSGMASAGRAATPLPEERHLQLGGYFVQPGVDLLKRFGIIAGDPGGDMRLGATITRGEMAKVVVAAMGQEPFALLALSGEPAFSDTADHWARGYIAVARTLGVAGGYEDRTFRPGNPVSNAEAVTMLLRAAGLRPQGAWPDSYLSAARSAQVLVPAIERELPPHLPATRGAVFLLAERAFSQVADAQGKSLLERVFGQPPLKLELTVLGAKDGVTTDSMVTVAGEAPDAVLAQVNGIPAWVTDGRFAVEIGLQPGVNEIWVVAVDQMGLRTEQRLTVERKA